MTDNGCPCGMSGPNPACPYLADGRCIHHPERGPVALSVVGGAASGQDAPKRTRWQRLLAWLDRQCEAIEDWDDIEVETLRRKAGLWP